MAEDMVVCAYEGNVACFALLHGNVCTFSSSYSSEIWLLWQTCCDYPISNRHMSWHSLPSQYLTVHNLCSWYTVKYTTVVLSVEVEPVIYVTFCQDAKGLVSIIFKKNSKRKFVLLTWTFTVVQCKSYSVSCHL